MQMRNFKITLLYEKHLLYSNVRVFAFFYNTYKPREKNFNEKSVDKNT